MSGGWASLGAMMDERLDFPATGRNREAIAAVLAEQLPERGTVLEVASGSGQHLAFFAQRWPDVRFVPSDPDPRHRASVAAWTDGLANVAPPLDLDVLERPWPVDAVIDYVFCANLIHISPFSCTEALFAGAAHCIRQGGRLWLYGPFVQSDVATAPSNVAFDASLRERDPSWGLRHLGEVSAVALAQGFERREVLPMPANNLFVTFEHRTPPGR